MKVYLVAAAALLASARFTDTVNLGAVLVGILIVVGFAWASRKDKRTERWESLYNLADTERKELQAKLNTLADTVQEQKEIIAKLDALQMPVKIVELMNQSVVRIDEHARKRLELALQEMKELSRDHDLSAEMRTSKILEKLDEIIQKFPPAITGGL